MSILIGADIVPTQSNVKLFEEAQAETLIGSELCDLLKQSDYRILNLEVPLTDHQKPILKQGPNLKASTASIAGIKALGIDLLTLANNHIMDQDVQGLESTIKVLEKAEVAHVGAGESLQEAQKPHYFTVTGLKYGVYACAEHEFSIAEENKPGANPFDPLESLDHIEQMKTQCDYVIVLYHGGKEHYRYPSPYLQKVCRKMVDKGANLVVCQHSHCIGCEEQYKTGIIVYGQGNFIFGDEDNEYWNTSLLIQINDAGGMSYIPLRKEANTVRTAKDSDATTIMKEFLARSDEIKSPGFIEENYLKFACRNSDEYAMYLTGLRKNFIFRTLNKASGHRFQSMIGKRYRNKMGVAIRNFIECEAHRELLLKGLEQNKPVR